MPKKSERRSSAQSTVQPSSSSIDRRLLFGTVPLRMFLGVTFVYAGLQKISDPGFLQAGSSTYVGSQLEGFAAHSPIGFLITAFALPVPELAGIGVMVAELLIGALVLLGLATRWVAAAGALLSFVLFLSASWTVQPYFLGSDSIYTVAWITLVLVGDQGILSARRLLFEPAAPEARGRQSLADLGRRRLLLQAGGAAVAVVWVLAMLPRSRPAVQAVQTTPSAPAQSPVASPTGTRIGAVADLRSQGFLNFTDPGTGDPAVAVSLSGGSTVAFDAVCTHAGCTVSYDTTQRLITCPCHGAQFDPARGAAVVGGPAPTPLASIHVEVAADGGLYAV